MRDEKLLRSLVYYLGCGGYSLQASGNAGDFFCANFSDIHDKIIFFFTEYAILGIKALDFSDFVQLAYLMKDKGHLNQEGLDQ